VSQYTRLLHRDGQWHSHHRCWHSRWSIAAEGRRRTRCTRSYCRQKGRLWGLNYQPATIVPSTIHDTPPNKSHPHWDRRPTPTLQPFKEQTQTQPRRVAPRCWVLWWVASYVVLILGARHRCRCRTRHRPSMEVVPNNRSERRRATEEVDVECVYRRREQPQGAFLNKSAELVLLYQR